MPFQDLADFLLALEREGQLLRIRTQVDPDLEITEIATRVIREEGPALLFENVRGSNYPLAINLFGSAKRIELAIGREPGSVGRDLVRLTERVNPPSFKNLWGLKGDARKLLMAVRPKRVTRAPVQQIEEPPNLSSLPVIKCWPGDGGRFITFPLVLTKSPVTGRSNLGIYRMQVHSPASTGMHWQIQKGGGFHFSEAEELGKPLPVAVILGGDPALMIAGVLPLPEGIEELLFAAILRGTPTPMVQAKTLPWNVPASAEFVLEGQVLPGERAAEGPFGDHFGHYSNEAQFPVFRISTMTRKRNPIYPAAVVGKPPQEDRYLGDAVQEILNPLLKLIRPEVEDLWAYYEAGFQNLLAASVKTRYTKEPMKTALGLFGEGQVSLTKCIILVGPGVNVRDFGAVLQEVRQHFDPAEDFLLLPRVPLDTLDFTSFKMHLGSKIALDATPKANRSPVAAHATPNLRSIASDIEDWRVLEDTLLVVRVKGPSQNVLQRLVSEPALGHLKIIALVSLDVDLKDNVQVLWGIFTRFDPARDIVFPEMRLIGASPVYRGPMGIDATHKPGYPAPLAMDEGTIRRVDTRWTSYWR